MPNNNRVRSYVQEKEAEAVLQDHGLDAVRARGSDGRSLGLAAGVDIRAMVCDDPFRLQCKRQKRPFSKQYQPAEDVEAQVIRSENDKQQWAIMRLQDLAALLARLDEADRKLKLHGKRA